MTRLIPFVPIPVQPTVLKVEIEAFKRYWGSKTNLVNILEVNDPFDSDCNEEIQEELAVASSSQDHGSLHEEGVDENVQILDEMSE